MFNPAYVDILRRWELDAIRRHIPAGARVLEIGGGSGVQAKMLAEAGYDIHSIDVAPDKQRQVFPIMEYDGRHLPFPDADFDVIFSSNVLEHVQVPGVLHEEMKRVLRADGYGVHVVPTATWRFWTIVTHYLDLVPRITMLLSPRRRKAARQGPSRRSARPASVSAASSRKQKDDASLAGKRAAGSPLVLKVQRVFGALGRVIWCRRHGERGNALTELWTFSRWAWARYFRGYGWSVQEAEALALLYTGNMLLGASLSLAWRQRLAKGMGSSCRLFVIEPNRQHPSKAGQGGMASPREGRRTPSLSD